jgi:hypothetical protein
MLFIKRHKDEVKLPMTAGRLPPSPLIGVIGRACLIFMTILLELRGSMIYSSLKLSILLQLVILFFLF